MRTIVTLLSILVCLLAVPRAEARDLTVDDVVGTYQCEGTNPDGKPYRGIVEVVALPNGVVYARWTLENGDQALGVGLVRRGLLVLSYYGTAAGTAIYVLPDAGNLPNGGNTALDGEWTAAGARDVYRERLVKLPAGHPAPTPAPGRHRPPAGGREIQG